MTPAAGAAGAVGAGHLYVHVPFCAHRCGYCAFVTVSEKPELHDRYVKALERELQLRGDVLDTAGVDTVFIGGGTPTLLGPSPLQRLLRAVRSRTREGAEITIECNPETVTPELAQLLHEGGATRVSLGAQSFQSHVLQVLERRATPEVVAAAVETLRRAGVDNLNLDLLWGVPGQTSEDLSRDLDAIVALSPEHVSAYELEFKPGTRLTRSFGSADDAVGDAADDFYDQVVDHLAGAGYEWYESANFARDGRSCRHNTAYWRQRDYLGIGIGAVSTLGTYRITNRPSIARYLTALEGQAHPPADREELSERIRRQERIMLALRINQPCELQQPDFDDVVDTRQLERLHSAGMLSVDGSRIELTRPGRMIANTVLAHLLV